MSSLEPLLPESPRAGKSGDVVSTVAILLLLAIHFADQEPLWQRAARKASREYLTAALDA